MENRRLFLKEALVIGAVVAPLLSNRASSAPQQPFRDRLLAPSGRISKAGTFVAATGNLVYAVNEEGFFSFRVSDDAVVWKGREVRGTAGLSMLHAGDRIYVSGDSDPSGGLVAKQICANIVNFFGLIVRVSREGYEVLLQPRSSNAKNHKDEIKSFIWNNDTVVGMGSLGDIRTGRYAQTVGLALPNGKILATRVFVYERNGLPPCCSLGLMPLHC